jgi:putative ABC transport system permease protein
MARRPGYAAVVLLTLSIGIGATTAVFSVINAVLLRPYPYSDPDGLIMVWERREEFPRFAASPANFLDWRERNTVFEDMAAAIGGSVTLTGEGEPERVVGRRVSASFLPILGVEPALGRGFLPEEDVPGGEPVVVLGHGIWRRRFGSDPEIVGKKTLLDDTPHTVVGVLPEGFRFFTEPWNPQDVEIWRPYPFGRDPPTERAVKRLRPILARLAPGVTLEQAQQEMDAIARALEEEFPGTNEGWGVNLGVFGEEMVTYVRPTLLILFGAVLFVLLIACANVANLMLARGLGRSKEIAIRTSIGAGRRRLAQQLLTESALIGLVGGGIGLVLAGVGIPLLVAVIPASVPRLDEVRVDAWVLAFTVLVALVTALVSGLIPAVRGSRADLTPSLKEGGARDLQGRRRLTGRDLLVVMEIGLAVVLLAGAGLMLYSFLRLQRVDPGIQSEGLLVAEVGLPRTRYAVQAGSGTHRLTEQYTLWKIRPEQVAFVQEVISRIEAEPGVFSVAAVNFPPVSGQNWGLVFRVEGRPPPETPEERLGGYAKAITAGYLETVGIPILRGRGFSGADREGAPEVIIVNRALVDRVFPGEEPIGARLLLRDGVEDQERAFEIVGVVGNVKQEGLATDEPELIFYIPYRQQAPAYVDWQVGFRMRVSFVVRARGDVAAFAPAVRRAIWAVDPDLPVQRVRTVEQIITEGLGERRLYGILLGVFAGIGFVLAALGVYGLMAYTVSRRIHEIGVRMVLGASRREVLSLVLRRGLALGLAGVAVGLGGAWALTRLIESQLFGITPTDPVTLGVVSVTLLVTAMVATFLPAHRATRVDPMESLRSE